MKANFEYRVAFLATAVLLSGCSQDGALTTGGLNTSLDPACVTIASQIKTLEDQGVPDKAAKAANKEYELNSSDLMKVAQLKKANAQFKARCLDQSPYPDVAEVPANANKKATAAAKSKIAAKTPPPVPAHKPSAASLAAKKSNAQAKNKPAAGQPSIETGTISGAPSAQSKPATAQTAPKTAVPVSAPAAQDNSEAAQLAPLPEMQIPSVLVPSQ